MAAAKKSTGRSGGAQSKKRTAKKATTTKKAAPSKLTWHRHRVRLGDLKPHKHNPKTSDDDTRERLRDSIDTLGQFETIAVDHDGVSCADGHQRLNTWIEHLGADFEVEAMRASRKLTKEEWRKIVLYSGKGTHGQWDFDMLQEHFTLPQLTEWGGFEKNIFNGGDDTPPDEFPDHSNLTVTRKCPDCGYEW